MDLVLALHASCKSHVAEEPMTDKPKTLTVEQVEDIRANAERNELGVISALCDLALTALRQKKRAGGAPHSVLARQAYQSLVQEIATVASDRSQGNQPSAGVQAHASLPAAAPKEHEALLNRARQWLELAPRYNGKARYTPSDALISDLASALRGKA